MSAESPPRLRTLAGVFALALWVRARVAANAHALYPDGAVELELARALVEGRWIEAIDTRFHPAYACLVALAHASGLALESAGVVVAALCASWVAPCALWLAWLWAPATWTPAQRQRAAWVAGALAAVHPSLARLGGQALAYGLAHACLAQALLAASLAWSRRSAGWALACGLAIGAGYSARSDGLATGAGLLCALALLLALARAPKIALRLLLAAALGLALGCAPYVLALHARTGTWQLSLKKSVRSVVVPPESARQAPRAPTLAERVGVAATGIPPSRSSRAALPQATAFALRKASGAAHPLFLVLACLASLPWRGSRPSRGLLLAWGGALAFVLAHVLLKANWGYTSRLHQSALGVFVSPLAALGLIALLRGRSKRLQVVALTLLLALALPKALKPQRVGREGERWVGAWIRADAGTGPLRVAGRGESRVAAFHASARFVELPAAPPAQALRSLEAQRCRYLVLYLRHRAPLQEALRRELLAAGAEPGPVFETKQGRRHYTWWVFRLRRKS